MDKQTKRPRTNTQALNAINDAVDEQHNGFGRHAAEACDINENVFSSIRRGRRVPGSSHKQRLEIGLGVSQDLWPVVKR